MRDCTAKPFNDLINGIFPRRKYFRGKIKLIQTDDSVARVCHVYQLNELHGFFANGKATKAMPKGGIGISANET
jgi:hypothetical protein